MNVFTVIKPLKLNYTIPYHMINEIIKTNVILLQTILSKITIQTSCKGSFDTKFYVEMNNIKINNIKINNAEIILQGLIT